MAVADKDAWPLRSTPMVREGLIDVFGKAVKVPIVTGVKMKASQIAHEFRDLVSFHQNGEHQLSLQMGISSGRTNLPQHVSGIQALLAQEKDDRISLG